ncbi:MAG: hypothetical protein LBN03_00290 [Bifidobacteriaceae bacterium]|jgi:hypothetical protein|nr:hypothetical protein [Bifidobacteriaceae bacterium]
MSIDISTLKILSYAVKALPEINFNTITPISSTANIDHYMLHCDENATEYIIAVPKNSNGKSENYLFYSIISNLTKYNNLKYDTDDVNTARYSAYGSEHAKSNTSMDLLNKIEFPKFYFPKINTDNFFSDNDEFIIIYSKPFGNKINLHDVSSELVLRIADLYTVFHYLPIDIIPKEFHPDNIKHNIRNQLAKILKTVCNSNQFEVPLMVKNHFENYIMSEEFFSFTPSIITPNLPKLLVIDDLNMIKGITQCTNMQISDPALDLSYFTIGLGRHDIEQFYIEYRKKRNDMDDIHLEERVRFYEDFKVILDINTELLSGHITKETLLELEKFEIALNIKINATLEKKQRIAENKEKLTDFFETEVIDMS